MNDVYSTRINNMNQSVLQLWSPYSAAPQTATTIPTSAYYYCVLHYRAQPWPRTRPFSQEYAKYFTM